MSIEYIKVACGVDYIGDVIEEEDTKYGLRLKVNYPFVLYPQRNEQTGKVNIGISSDLSFASNTTFIYIYGGEIRIREEAQEDLASEYSRICEETFSDKPMTKEEAELILPDKKIIV